jgi:hypothetical protein
MTIVVETVVEVVAEKTTRGAVEMMRMADEILTMTETIGPTAVAMTE